MVGLFPSALWAGDWRSVVSSKSTLADSGDPHFDATMALNEWERDALFSVM